MENRSPATTSSRAYAESSASSNVGIGRENPASSSHACKSRSDKSSGQPSQSRQRQKGHSKYGGPSHARQQNAVANATSRSNDPFVNRQQAEAAALEAFNRAQPACESVACGSRPKLERRRSRASGRTEGGHFEEARLGRRKSGNGKTKAKARSSPQRSSEAPSTATRSGRDEERVVTRKRSVIPPSSSQHTEKLSEALSVPATTDRGRKRQSQTGYSDGSPMPRNGGASKQRSSESQVAVTSHGSHLGDTTSSRTATTNKASEGVSSSRHAPRRPDRSSHVDDGIIAQARDKCLQDFQQKKLRERKSMILAPFQKLRTGNTFSSRSSGYDTSLPPYNYADEGVPMPPSPPPFPPPAVPVYTIPVHEVKSRSFTESVKGRFMKVFRKPSRVQSGLPAQHIEGKTFQFTTTTPSSMPDVVPAIVDDPFVASNQHLAVPDPRAASAVSKRSTDTTSKSRVTSWTNSTIHGTWSTRSETDKDASADEHGRLKRNDSVSTLRKAKSFFGRPIQNKLRRASRAQLQSSEESTGLYSALQEQIHPSDSASQAANNDDTITSRTSSALATLPSQQRPSSTMGRSIRRTGPTIRSVTPDPTAYKLDIPSPVEEVLSPDLIPPPSRKSKAGDESDTPRSQLQRRPAMKAPTPSKDQLARRMERSKNRWQSPLDEMSSAAVPSYSRAGMMDDNPYELRSLSRTLQQAPAASDALPHHARLVEDVPKQDTRAENVLSPSLYSRATDGASPRPDTPIDQGGMMITITGREVRSYSISPQKRDAKTEKPVLASGEWRRWLSNEWKGWNGNAAGEALALPKTILQADGPVAKYQEEGPEEQRLDTETPPLKAPPLETQQKRPRPRSSRSSFMNERYPMVDSGRTSIDTRKLSSEANSRPTSAGIDSRMSGTADRKDLNIETAAEDRPTSVIHRQRPVSKHQSIAGLAAAGQENDNEHIKDQGKRQALAATSDNQHTAATTITNQEPYSTKAAMKAKSAFDLRTNYKNRHNGNIRPIPINRHKPDSSHRATVSSPIHILEDTTIQNISAGPYAQSSPLMPNTNKENETPPPLRLASPVGKGLPQVSSSEWLAAGTSKNKTRKTSTVHPAMRERSASRYSPSRRVTGTASPASGLGGSPGQRLVTSWLDGKKGNENSPAFV